eukprot:bmy_17440T0
MTTEVRFAEMRFETLSVALPGNNMVFNVMNMSIKDIYCDNMASDSKNDLLWKQLALLLRWPNILKSIDAAITEGVCNKIMCVESLSDYPSLGHFAAHDMRQTVAVDVIMTVGKKSSGAG